MTNFSLFFKFFLTFVVSALCYSEPSVLPSPSAEVVLSDPQWKGAVLQFQGSITDLTNRLDKNKNDFNLLQKNINRLEVKIEELRQNTQSGSNVFDEIRLKGLLNDLKDDLEKSSVLQHDRDDQQKEFEQKTLSAIELYNNKIESELKSSNASESFGLQQKINTLSFLIQKRNQLQILMKKYRTKPSPAENLPIVSLGSLKTDDREGLQMTLDLIRDRKKDLEEKLEKWSIEQDEIKNELKLQGEMQDFLEGIKRMNEDSDFASGNMKKNNLSDITFSKQIKSLESHFNEIQGLIKHGQESLAQLDQFTEKVQNQLATSSEERTK